MILEFLKINWDNIVLVVAGVGAYFKGRGAKKSNEKSLELTNLSTVRGMEKQLIQDLKDQCEEFREIIEMNKIIISQKDEIIEEQKKILSKQKRSLAGFVKKFGELTH